MKYEFDICKKCGKKRLIVNKIYGLCKQCNHYRLYGETEIETAKKKIKNNNAIIKDEKFYEEIFYSKPCICENCGKVLPEKFRDENGKVIARYQYSHILSKGAWPQYRYEKWNIMKNCLKCHQEWDFGQKQNMLIYNKNKNIIIKKTGRDLLV